MSTIGFWRPKAVADATSYWWLLLITGGLWVVLSLAILQFNLTSVWSIAILTGIVLLMAGLTELMIMAIAPGWRWVHLLLSVLFLAGGIIAFAWPESTFLVLARLFGWYLLFLGTFEVVDALAFRHTELWWLRLILGAATIGIAFWAVDSTNRSAVLLVLWVGLGALFRGIDHIFLAFEYRRLHESARALADPLTPRSDRDEHKATPVPH